MGKSNKLYINFQISAIAVWKDNIEHMLYKNNMYYKLYLRINFINNQMCIV